MSSSFRMPSRRLAAASAGLACLPLLAGACISFNLKGYPAVERTDLAPLVASTGDTAWVLARPPLTVIGRSRAGLEVPVGLTGVVRSWERIFGVLPPPATVVLVELSDRSRAPAPPPLPDTLARGTVVWVPTVRFANDDRRTGPPADVRMAGGGGSPALQLAQAWLDARTMSSGSGQSLPPWLRAGLVEALGGLDVVDLRRRGLLGRGGDEPLPALDTLLARQCPAGWAPVVRWQPSLVSGADSVGIAPSRRSRRDRAEEIDDLDRAGADDARLAPCGPRLRIAAGSFVHFLLERAGDTTGDALVRAYAAGGTLEQALAGRTGLPATRADLQRAWHAWESQRREDTRNRRPM